MGSECNEVWVRMGREEDERSRDYLKIFLKDMRRGAENWGNCQSGQKASAQVREESGR